MSPGMHGILAVLDLAVSWCKTSLISTALSKAPQPQYSACHHVPVTISRPLLLVQRLLQREAEQIQTRVHSCSFFSLISKYMFLAVWQPQYLRCSSHKNICASAKWQVTNFSTDYFQTIMKEKHLVDWIESVHENQQHFSVSFKSWNVQVPRE